jgi:hypothetical protein
MVVVMMVVVVMTMVAGLMVVVVVDLIGHGFCFSLRPAVHDTRGAGPVCLDVGRNPLHDIFFFVWLGLLPQEQVRAIERTSERFAAVDAEKGFHVPLDRRGGRGRHGQQGHGPKRALDDAQFGVVFAKIMTPLATAMAFVNHEALQRAVVPMLL